VIRNIGGKKVYIGIISHLRAKNVQDMEKLVGKATWYVGEGEGEAYTAQGATKVIESGGLCESRNAILNDAFANGCFALELSDDLKKLEMAVDKENKNKKQLKIKEAVELMLEAAEKNGAKMVGTAPTNNAYFFNPSKPYHTQAFIVGDMILVEPTELRFDENLKLKEDYDYTLQHIVKYGCVARVNALMPTFVHRSNAGGACDYRNARREQRAIRYLKAKWGDFIADNPRRPNEILLKIKNKR
jgi:hypothetical protein